MGVGDDRPQLCQELPTALGVLPLIALLSLPAWALALDLGWGAGSMPGKRAGSHDSAGGASWLL